MKVGDKVRLLKSTEEGKISKILDSKVIEVEIEDGFNIPVLMNEVVVVNTQEAQYFRSTEKEVVPPKKVDPVGPSGIFLAFLPINDRLLSLHIINNTSSDALIALSTREESGLNGLFANKIAKFDAEKITNMERINFDQWPKFNVQLLFFKEGFYEENSPVELTIKFKASTLFRASRLAPIISKEAFLYQIHP